ncbi:MAG: hypothetical protein OEZ65_09420 [Gemmatimonadota bacterium]|nr:hypothetical protein [Gemmatimonadota bacterium]MDH5759794.1 hypothetical protein [Gemmatimonadota bacterium]
MHRNDLRWLAVAAALTVGAAGAQAQEQARIVENGGIHVDGWMGRIDAAEAGRGQVLENARLAMEDGALHVTTGPAVAYWNPANTASGSYMVGATFHEPAYMNRNNHPHPYGVFIGGSDMGTDQQSYLYCAAYGNGNFIVRGFGPEPFQVNGRRGETSEAVHQAAAAGEPVTQEISITVTPETVSCSINGTVVGSYPVTDVVGAGKLTSTDGVFGIRFGHNTEATVTGLHKM